MSLSYEIVLIDEPITRKEVEAISQKSYGEMVKGVVDLQKGIMAIGSELHADEEEFLLDRGSRQSDLWGINIFRDLPREKWIVFDSMINLRPSQGNRSRSVEDEGIRAQISELVDRLITD